MCLSTLEKTHKTPKKGVKVGYKSYYKSSRPRHVETYSQDLKIGQWHDSDSKGVIETTSNFVEYEPGFHIFTSKRAACKYGFVGRQIYQVKYDEVIHEGTQSVGPYNGKLQAKCVIARRMMIVKEIPRSKRKAAR